MSKQITTRQLTRGTDVSLTRIDPTLRRVIVGLGWDASSEDGEEIDLDAMVFLLNREGRVRTDQDFVFYNNLQGDEGSVVHTGDNQTGEGDGDDESLDLDLVLMSMDIEKIVFVVALYDSSERGQHFGMVTNAFIRIVNEETNVELARFDLTEDASGETVMVFGEMERNGVDWSFKAIGRGYEDGLRALAVSYGVNME